MSTDRIDWNNPTEVPPKDAKAELTEEELAKVSAGSLSMPFREFKVVYKAQTSY
jgi:hypothetical protein